RYYVRDIVSGKFYPDELYSEMFGMAARLNAKVIGVEETSLNEFIKQPIKNYMHSSGSFYQLIWLTPRGGERKAGRIKHLVPLYRQGQIYHNMSCCGGLEAQLLSFPRSKKWDIMDMLAYLVPMLEIGERYFAPMDDPDEYNFDDMDYEEPLSNWRVA
ncbi:MAG: hypothetical protein M0R51_13225, partial [Clostridia bacterium]|nr:hypothetical protein [Clostridia bacterium]